jgi:hypothetical protein
MSFGEKVAAGLRACRLGRLRAGSKRQAETPAATGAPGALWRSRVQPQLRPDFVAHIHAFAFAALSMFER